MLSGTTLVALAASALQAAAPEKPQSDPPSDPAIIVTGERVSRSLRETPSSVDVTTARRIEALSGADRIEQILEQVPNVVLGSGGDGPAIRGQDTTGVLRDLPAFLGGNRPRTTLQIDGRAVSYNELAYGATGIWDIERIEVFRTPQTTTQGLNSIAGALFIKSKDPTYDWNARGRIVLGNYQTRQASAAVSGPLVADQLAFRAVADLRRGRPSSKIVDITRNADPNHDDYNLLRFKLLGEPRFWPGARLDLTYAHSESFQPTQEGIRPPFSKRRDPVDRYGSFATNVDSVAAILEHPVAKDLRAKTTLSYGKAHVRRFSNPGFGETGTHSHDFSAETVLDWNPGGPVRLVGGVSHRRSSLDQFIDLSLFIGVGQFDDEQLSLGLFGELTLQALPRTTVTAGLRYQRDRQQRSGSIGTPGRQVPLDYDGTFSAWLPKLSIAYDLTDDVRAGVLVQRAYNPGGTTLQLNTGAQLAFDAETLWNYELFVRSRLAHGAVLVTGNAFYTAMRDAQRFRFYPVRLPGGPVVTLAEIFNVPKARSYGAELTVDWRASDRLNIRTAVGLLGTKITQTDTASQVFDGREFARSPGLTASAGVDWQPTQPLRLSTQVRHVGSYFSDDLNTAERRIGEATFVDARASWETKRLTLFGYVRNLFDAFRLRFNNGGVPPLAVAHDPREVGLGIEARF